MNNPLIYTDPSGYRYKTAEEMEHDEISQSYMEPLRNEGYHSFGFGSGGGNGPIGWSTAGSNSGIGDIFSKLNNSEFGGSWTNGNYSFYKTDPVLAYASTLGWDHLYITSINNTPIILGSVNGEITEFKDGQILATENAIVGQLNLSFYLQSEAVWGTGRGSGNASGGGSDIWTPINVALGAGGIYASGKQYLNVVNGEWRGANGLMNSLEWGGNKYTGARSIAIGKANYYEAIGKKLFFLSTAISAYQGVNALIDGDIRTAKKSGLDIFMGVVGVYGGPVGVGVSGLYFFIDNVRTDPRPARMFDPNICRPDNTRVSINGF